MQLVHFKLTFLSCCSGKNAKDAAAVSCSANVAWLAGTGLGFWLTGKLGRAWVGAWVSVWVVGS